MNYEIKTVRGRIYHRQSAQFSVSCLPRQNIRCAKKLGHFVILSLKMYCELKWEKTHKATCLPTFFLFSVLCFPSKRVSTHHAHNCEPYTELREQNKITLAACRGRETVHRDRRFRLLLRAMEMVETRWAPQGKASPARSPAISLHGDSESV